MVQLPEASQEEGSSTSAVAGSGGAAAAAVTWAAVGLADRCGFSMKTISYGLRLETPRWLYPHSDTEDFVGFKRRGRNISRHLLSAHEPTLDQFQLLRRVSISCLLFHLYLPLAPDKQQGLILNIRPSDDVFVFFRFQWLFQTLRIQTRPKCADINWLQSII